MTYTIPSFLSGEMPSAAKWASLTSVLTTMGTDLDAATARAPIRAVKSTDTGRTSTTYVADPHLAMAFAASKTYELSGWLIVEGDVAGDLKMRMSWTGSGTRFGWGIAGLAAAATTFEGSANMLARPLVTTSPTGDIIVGVNGSTWTTVLVSGRLEASQAGTLTLDWAPNAATGTTTIKETSWLRLDPV